MSDEATTHHHDDADEPASANPTGVDRSAAGESLDLERIERDLAGVEAALGRLDDGTYWTDEVTGQPIPDATLALDPVARRAG